MFRPLLLLAPLMLLGCAAEDASRASTDDANLGEAYWSTSRSKTLAPPIAVPTGTAIGDSMEATLAAKSAGFVEESRSTREVKTDDGQTIAQLLVVYRSTTKPTLTLLHAVTPTVPTRDGKSFFPGMDILKLIDDGQTLEHWVDHPDDSGKLDGKIDGYRNEALGRSYDDDNFDGKIDRWIEAVANIPGFVVEGYPGCRPPAVMANRILEDLNFDGSFERESITGKASSDSVWICETRE